MVVYFYLKFIEVYTLNKYSFIASNMSVISHKRVKFYVYVKTRVCVCVHTRVHSKMFPGCLHVVIILV